MKTEQIIKTLQDYNDWRRARGKWDVDTLNEGESFFDSVTAYEMGLTIDSAIERLQALEKERDQAREEIKRLKNGSYLQSLSASYAKSALNNPSK